MAHALLASSFSTPGRRAFGRRGVLPDGFLWGGVDWGGLVVAEGVVTDFTEERRAPCFGTGTTVVNKKDGVTSPVLVLAFIYEEEVPSVVVALVHWTVDNVWLREYYSSLLGAPTVSRLVNQYPDATHVAEWPDSVSLIHLEFGVVIDRWPGTPHQLVLVGRVDEDEDVHCMPGIIRRVGWCMQYVPLDDGWGVRDLISDENWASFFLEQPISPPSGIVPLAADFDAIADDAMRIYGVTVVIGGAPTKPMHTIKVDEVGNLGWIQGRATNEAISIRHLRRLDHPEIAPLLDHDVDPFDRAWGRRLDSEVVLTDTVATIPIAALPRPIERITVVPTAMYHDFRLSTTKVRALALKAAVDAAADGDAAGDAAALTLTALQSPLTPAYVVQVLAEHTISTGSIDVTYELANLRNEMYAQVTPEKTVQPSLANALVQLRGYDFSKLQGLMHAAGRRLTWIGDRGLTFEYHLTSLDDILTLFGMVRAGWIVPEKDPARNGAKRKRLARHLGFILLFFSGSNFIRYSLEKRTLEIFLSVGFYGTNLMHFRGAEPEAGAGVYDIVTRTWRAPNAQPPLTLARAKAHYVQEAVFQ